MPKTQEELIDEVVELWVSNWKTLKPKEREKHVRSLLKTLARSLSKDRLEAWYSKLWAGTH